MSLSRLLVGLLLVVLGLLLPEIAQGQSQTISYADGDTRWQYQHQEGMPEGESLQFYTDGSLMVRGSYRQGLKHGLFWYYANDGTLRERALYVHGKREWRSFDSAAADAPPMELLANERDPLFAPATGKLEPFSHPFLLVIPFSSLDRLSRRIGVAFGTSSEGGDLNGRRGEFFVNAIKGIYGAHTSVALSMVSGSPLFNESEKFLMEQMSISAVGSIRVVDRVKHLAFVRAGYSRSIDLSPDDETPVRGVTAGQRPSDYASTFRQASVWRLSANHFYMRKHFISQIDAGVDAVNHRSVETGEKLDDLVVRLNAGAATGTRTWKFALETANAINLGGRSLYTAGGTITYYSGSRAWTSLNSMVDQHGEVSILVGLGSWNWNLD